MPRKRSQKVVELEAKIQAALEGISSGKYTTRYQAAKALGLSEASLARRIKGGKSRYEAREKQQAMTKGEEKSLERWIERLTATGHPATHEFIREMAEEIRKQRDHDDADPNLPLRS